MDLSFLIATLVAQAIKVFWFKRDTRARDIVLPLLVLVMNFVTQLVAALGASGESPVPAELASQTLVQTGLSLGTHRGLRWMLSVLGGK